MTQKTKSLKARKSPYSVPHYQGSLDWYRQYPLSGRAKQTYTLTNVRHVTATVRHRMLKKKSLTNCKNRCYSVTPHTSARPSLAINMVFKKYQNMREPRIHNITTQNPKLSFKMSNLSPETTMKPPAVTPEINELVSSAVQQKAKEKEIVVSVLPQSALLISAYYSLIYHQQPTSRISIDILTRIR